MDCVARHETYGLNPSLFGRPIFDRAHGDRQRTRALLARKARLVRGYSAAHYLETSHAFLKSWSDLAGEFFPGLKLIHLIRDPLKVAKSEAYREQLFQRLHLPFCHYRGPDGRRYFYWSLTGHEPTFTAVTTPLTRFQWYLLQWIEIEHRALACLQAVGSQHCFTLRSPRDLVDPQQLERLLEFLEMRRRSPLVLAGRQNRNWRPTLITDEDRRQCAAVVALLPPHTLQIFAREPYCSSLDPDTRALLTATSS